MYPDVVCLLCFLITTLQHQGRNVAKFRIHTYKYVSFTFFSKHGNVYYRLFSFHWTDNLTQIFSFLSVILSNIFIMWPWSLPENKTIQNQAEELAHHRETAGRSTLDRTQTPRNREKTAANKVLEQSGAADIWSITAPLCPSGAGASAACKLRLKGKSLVPQSHNQLRLMI